MKFADSHAHLHPPEFTNNNLNQIVAEALEANVTTIVNCASFPKDYFFVRSSSSFDEVYFTLGIQPTIAQYHRGTDWEILFADILNEEVKFKGIGEVGLDYYWVKTEKERKIQQEVFKTLIETANSLNLNLIIHCRKAEEKTLELLEMLAEVPVLLHSFEGNLEACNKAKDLGYKVTVPTNVTIRKNRKKVVQRMGLENILLETDSPYCSPSPEIKINSPKTVPIAAQTVTKVLGATLEDVANVTTNNFTKFYKI